MAATGDLVDVDDDVEEMRRLDRARVLIRTPWKLVIHHSVAVHIGDETHTVYLVEENANKEGMYVRHRRSTIGSSEEILSDDSDPDTPFSRLSVLSPGIIADEHTGGHSVRWIEKVPNDGQGSEDPTVKDQGSRAHYSITELCMPDRVRRNQLESAAEPRPEVSVGYDKMKMSNDQKTNKLETEKKLVVKKSKGSMESKVEEQTKDIAQGQKEVGIKCLNRKQQHPLKLKLPLDPNVEPAGPNNKMGLANNAPVEDSQGPCTEYTGLTSNTHGQKSQDLCTNYHQHLVENGSA